ncbi:hypothetical protein OIO90_004136 [Microbotryomycetes sp. JL221]|nr:hypothetical protein OIO90_004136 [Microbotryomycetes sp. JL221]
MPSGPLRRYPAVTWSQLVRPELVENLSDRERARQEILWEMVSSEERYAAELASTVKAYVRPLLQAAATTSSRASSQLPRPSILATQLTALENSSPSSSNALPTSSISSPSVANTEDGAKSEGKNRHSHSRMSILSILGKVRPSSTVQLDQSGYRATTDLPVATARVLEAIAAMGHGHAELSSDLRQRWQAEFPLARGVVALWTSQAWFLPVYTDYNNHTIKPPSKVESSRSRLYARINSLELEAHRRGEAGLAARLIMPLMRLAQMPLMLNSLLYHSDPALPSWTKVQEMAMSIEGLVRKLDQLKLQESRRIHMQQLLGRISGLPEECANAWLSDAYVMEETRCHAKKQSKWKRQSERWVVQLSNDIDVFCRKTGETRTAAGARLNTYEYVRHDPRGAASEASSPMPPSTRGMRSAAIDSLGFAKWPEEIEQKHGHKVQPVNRFDSSRPQSSIPSTDEASASGLDRRSSSIDLLQSFWAQEKI